jgi:hypothetical protein
LIFQFNTIQIDKVLADKKLPNWVLKAAFEVKYSGFLPTGEYFEKLDDVELLEIKNSLEYINTENYLQFEVMSEQSEVDLQNLTLLCFILALGEGDVEITSESLSGMLQYLFLLVGIESSYREGKVDVHRENYSLYGGNKPVVRNK